MVAAGKSAVDALKHRDDKVIVWYGFGDSPIGMVSKSTDMTAWPSKLTRRQDMMIDFEDFVQFFVTKRVDVWTFQSYVVSTMTISITTWVQKPQGSSGFFNFNVWLQLQLHVSMTVTFIIIYIDNTWRVFYVLLLSHITFLWCTSSMNLRSSTKVASATAEFQWNS